MGDTRNPKRAGQWTGDLGDELALRLEKRGLMVTYDHGTKEARTRPNIGEVVSWFGPKYTRTSRLALIDIAIFDPNTNRTMMLVEIEESSYNPKTVLKDAYGTLMGDRLTFKRERELKVGEFTTLMIFIPGDEMRHQTRVQHLEKQINLSKLGLTASNASIGKVLIRLYADKADLRRQLFEFVENE